MYQDMIKITWSLEGHVISEIQSQIVLYKSTSFASLVSSIQVYGSTMPTRKDTSKDLREATVRKNIHEWNTFKTVGNLPRSGNPCKFGLDSRSACPMLRKTAENPRAKSWTLQASVSMLILKFMTITLEGLEALPEENPLL